MGWEYVIYLAIALIVGYALAPKAPANSGPVAGEAEAPVSEEGKPVGVVFGEVVIKSANVVWYGDTRTSPITKEGGKK